MGKLALIIVVSITAVLLVLAASNPGRIVLAFQIKSYNLKTYELYVLC